MARNIEQKEVNFGSKALTDRIAAGMVDDTFRDEKGEPFLMLGPDGVVVPNGAASDEASLTKARAALRYLYP